MKYSGKNLFDKFGIALRSAGWRRSKGARLVIAVVLTLLLAVLFPQAQSPQNVTGYSVGSLWTSADVTAPFSFRLLKDNQRYRGDVSKALENFYPVFVIDSSAGRRSLDSLHNTLAKFSDLAGRSGSPPAADSLDKLSSSLGLSNGEAGALASYLNAHDRPLTGKQPGETANTPIENAAMKLLAHSYVVGSVPSAYSSSSDQKIAVRKRASEEQIVYLHDALTTDGAKNALLQAIERDIRAPQDAKIALAKIAAATLIPNLTYSAEQTDESKKSIIDRVPKTDGVILEGQKIIAKGEVITPAAKSALESLAQARIDLGGPGAIVARAVGTIGHVAIIVLLFVLYVKFIRRRIYKDNAQLLLISVILIFPALMAYVSVGIHTSFPLEYFILIPVTSMLLTVLFDSRTGFYGTVITALLVAGIRGNDYNVALAGLSAGAFAAYTVRDLRSRSQLFKSIGYIFLGYFIAITALAFERGAPLKDIALELAAAAGNALISPVLTLGLVFVVEAIFDTMSDLRLADFNDINHPLLRRLALEAPGTYHHTMLVSQLAENAALAIGANSLLAKVGAMFHDVGKIASPADFIENQSHENIHDSISSAESAARVRAHVTAGIALAREEKLPEKIIDFIPMHHGTLRISFFYQKALSLVAAGGTLDDTLYRYPGPKPNTKETAVVMLADASEAVARTLLMRVDEPTVELIEADLAALFRERIADGQLDECDLTLHDLVIIRNVFARLLIGSFHSRISYPQPPQQSLTYRGESEAAKVA
ncbi:MAG: HDIG domain-containing protein [Bacteroidota bacterium]|nr:HDIG domain-containing protein [Bacteroidota bacterium]MDP4229610.1 HDIG domain-containing protein [Bacteroidota bacterium]